MMDIQARPTSFFQEQQGNRTFGAASGGQSNPGEVNFASDYQTFLRLMTAQLKNQDPLSPTDPTQFLSQIAQFSTVEQQLRTNSNLEQIAMTLGSSVDRLDLSYLGRQVEALSDIVGLKGENTPKIAYTLAGAAETSKIVISNSKNEVVRTVDGQKHRGRHDFVWDGKDDYGNRLPDDLYRIQVVATTEEQEPIETHVAITDRVEEVLKINGQTWLSLSGGSSILPDSVMVVRQVEAESEA